MAIAFLRIAGERLAGRAPTASWHPAWQKIPAEDVK